ncbi:hypothetical protein [Flavihumibacter sp. UBA7668]|uniref:hypothetical protein n=1 Tax=Flavihumibacter sp. UBA7668 TaxID=1946542 RepID=UPI0025C64E1B|nr:hypothetical protein [Flavihumibacter sp. UBA7668]
MAIADDNIIVRLLRGKLGKFIVFRVVNGKTFVSKYPDMSRVERSPNQRANNTLFSDAMKHANSVLNNPQEKASLQKRMKTSAKLKDRNPLNVLVGEFMKEKSDLLSNQKATEKLSYYRAKYELSDRQAAALHFLIRTGQINNSMYQEISRVSKPTASRDLANLVNLGILFCMGKGPSTTYKLQDLLVENGLNT